MVKIPAQGIYVVLIDIAKQNTLMGTVKFLQNRLLLTIAEVLKFFNVTLDPGVKIWIKRNNQDTCRDKDYEQSASLPWEHFNNCVIALSYYRPEAAIFQTPHQSLSEKKFEDDKKAQEALWQEKRRKKEKRGGKAPLYIALKNKVLQAIKKRKTKARIEAELAKKEKTEKQTE
ncbi:MAG: hypothetical protein Q7S12_01760 [bacterium]|nr:hypothetical protein [bacterium]